MNEFFLINIIKLDLNGVKDNQILLLLFLSLFFFLISQDFIITY